MARQKEQLFKDITLAPAVSAKVDTIMMDASKKQTEAMAAARAGGGDMAAFREQTQKMNADRNTALKALLTDEQKKKFDENVGRDAARSWTRRTLIVPRCRSTNGGHPVTGCPPFFRVRCVSLRFAALSLPFTDISRHFASFPTSVSCQRSPTP